MPDTTPRHWHRWRVTHAAPPSGSPGPPATADRFGRRGPARPPRQPAPVTASPADGIRHDLVERVRREIAAGTYDTEEKWLAAEEALLRRIENR